MWVACYFTLSGIDQGETTSILLLFVVLFLADTLGFLPTMLQLT